MTALAIVPQISPAPNLFERIKKLLGLHLPLRSEEDILRLVLQGLPTSSLDRLLKHGVDRSVVVPLIGAETTIRRRVQEEAKFTAAESERLMRVIRVYAQAVDLFGDEETAKRWLMTPAQWLADSPPIKPIMLAAPEPGARLIEQSLLRTAHGIY